MITSCATDVTVQCASDVPAPDDAAVSTTDNGGAATGYLVERQDPGSTNFTQVGTATGTNYFDTGLAGNTNYSYRVRATDAAGNLSGYSTVASATTLATTPGLVAAYSFNEGSGTTVADSSGNGNVGTISGATWTGAGQYGSALVFNGTSALVTISNSASLQLTTAMTLEAWVNPSVVNSAWRDLIYKGNDNYYLEGTSTASGVPAGGGTFGGANANAYGTAALPVNAWTHLALTYDGATLRLYTNGVQVSSLAQTGNIATSTNPLQIGGDSFYGQFFQGTIDEVRVYNVALTAAQIQADMNTPIVLLPPDTQPPTVPATVTATAVNDSEIILSWTASIDNVGVTAYLVERQDPGSTNFTQLGTTTGTNYNDTGLVGTTSYSYRVRAADAAGNLSEYSIVASVVTPAAGFSATDNFNRPDGSLGPNWTNTVAAECNLVVTNNQVGVDVETNHASAFWSASSFNDDQYSQATITKIGPFTGVILRADAVQDRFYMGFVFAANDYRIYARWDGAYYSLATGSTETWQVGDELRLEITGSSNPITITMYRNGHAVLSWVSTVPEQVRTGGSPGICMYSPVGQRLTLDNWQGGNLAPDDTQPPSVPASLAALAVSGSQIDLSWTASTDNVAVTAYLVERQDLGSTNFAQIGTVSGTNFFDMGLTGNTNYSYRVRAADAAGNLSGYSAVASATTLAPDTQPPSVPGNLTATALNGSQISLYWTASSDNCAGGVTISHDADVITTGDCPNRFIVTRVYHAMDACSNSADCTQTITVADTTAPVIACPADKVLACGESTEPSNTGSATATDNCGQPVTIAHTDAATPVNCTGSAGIDRTWTATDACGNVSSCVQHISFADTTAPVITCPADLTLECPANTTTNATGAATATDGCSSVAITYSDSVVNGCGGSYTLTRTWTATDVCGNHSSCDQTITVHDTTAPVAVCTNITVNLNTSGFATITAAQVDGGSYDGCGGGITRAISRSNFGCGDVGSNNVTLTVVDQCGNTNSCVAIVTVHDSTPPVISCPSNVTVTANPGQCFATGVSLGVPVVSDNCAVASVVSNVPSSYAVGTNLVVWTAADAVGNASSCTQQVFVLDNEPPAMTCPADVTVIIPAGMTCACNVTLGLPAVSDNCSVASLNNNAPSCYSVGTNLVLWTATDNHGNVSVCTQRVIVATVTLDSASVRIVAIQALGDDINLTWQTFGNTTNVIQLATPIIAGNYTNNFINLGTVVVPGSGVAVTNWVDHGGATNSPSRFYRIHLQPGAPCSP